MEENELKMIGLDEICKIFGCKKQKGRGILNVALQMRYATKVGKTIYMTREDLDKYLAFIKGKKVIV